MKTKLKYGIAAYSGTIDDITFASYKDGAVCIARKYVVPKLTENNTRMGNIARNLADLYAEFSEDYKSDLRTYTDIYNREKNPRTSLNCNAYSIFVKMMFKFADEIGETVNLTSITYDDIDTLYFDLANIAAAVEAGYLPKVSGCELLTNSI
ncbi:MAG: hypothetical protein PHY41_06580 [Candidatus Cloacimonetes bacterium]|nr:hypothetical protein [Candidatus Cloacimonadota bacterium]MDD3283121.1 hypothetical protein [Candidatus Cloacimonadota bacterium]MDD4232672.1 hypothetical protein [Candidatus Cloacimonadota bacterium]MDD4688074.1 hypothetical protein [Candidatus Cloacimonadota bacterium]